MSRNFKKLLILLLTILLPKICCFSQNISTEIQQDSIVCISTKQLKKVNLIFAEHDKLTNENIILHKEVELLEDKCTAIDSLRTLEVRYYKQQNESIAKDLQKQKKITNYWRLGSFTLSGLIILLLL